MLTEEREPAALTAKFTGMIIVDSFGFQPMPRRTIPGPFRVVLIRDGGLYQSFMCPTGQPLENRRLKLNTAKIKAASFFTHQIETWTECEKSKGLPV